MDKNKAEQEISALVTGITILGIAIPVATYWMTDQYSKVIESLVSLGVLERSDRILWDLYEGAGFDLGRILICAGLVILCLNIPILWIVKTNRIRAV